MLEAFRTERLNFPIFKEKIQLSSCSQSAMHVSVKEAVNDYFRTWEVNGMDWKGWMQACENARLSFAKMINADKKEVAIVSSVSHAASSIATSLIKNNRKKILVTELDFPTIGHVWQSHRDSFDVTFIKGKENDWIDKEDYNTMLDENTLLVSTSHVSYYDGYKQHLKEIADVVHHKGAYLFVDAYQSFGQCEIDVKKMNIDMLATGLQKYALGIPGIAFLYIKNEIAQSLTPKITGWFGQRNPFLFDIRNTDYADSTVRFDTGTFPMVNGFAAEAALKVLNKFSMDEVEKRLQYLSGIAIEEADKRGLQVKSPRDLERKGSNTAILVNNASEAESRLLKQNIILSARNDVLRIAPHFYNTEEEVITAVEAVADFTTNL
ncbi:aminotransferase class V-fold PLP-dependent enzyme [Alteribacillus sp. YIM 98480]|uniref:aminotransferase class V-fold PLP-dependent enzyme n=1 Tax=Alteribacillus sp. YIM 98480 TaxID=2606599 RepID=UPI00131CE16C|nr:aminotransferase class V-fold PLP-dependent enzyme [Alteribacillus sp. YIM 98480]